jgi:hypothetical protein
MAHRGNRMKGVAEEDGPILNAAGIDLQASFT